MMMATVVTTTSIDVVYYLRPADYHAYSVGLVIRPPVRGR